MWSSTTATANFAPSVAVTSFLPGGPAVSSCGNTAVSIASAQPPCGPSVCCHHEGGELPSLYLSLHLGEIPQERV